MLKEGTKTNMVGGKSSEQLPCHFSSLRLSKCPPYNKETRYWFWNLKMLIPSTLKRTKWQWIITCTLHKNTWFLSFPGGQTAHYLAINLGFSQAHNFSVAICFTCNSSLCSMKTLGSLVNSMTLQYIEMFTYLLSRDNILLYEFPNTVSYF